MSNLDDLFYYLKVCLFQVHSNRYFKSTCSPKWVKSIFQSLLVHIWAILDQFSVPYFLNTELNQILTHLRCILGLVYWIIALLLSDLGYTQFNLRQKRRLKMVIYDNDLVYL